MHDINRNDIFKKTSHSHSSQQNHGTQHTHEDSFSGHAHEHDELDEHFHNDHRHEERFESRAYNHVHEHSHKIQHAHHHKHNPEEDTFAHRIFNNPLKDWFALIFMSILLLINQIVPMDDKLSDGLLIVIIVTGLFPLLKNAFFDGIIKKRILPELVVAILLIGLIFSGELMTASIITIFIFLGSFLNLNFSWK